MQLKLLCESYFNGFQELSSFNHQGRGSQAKTLLKVISYITVVAPLSIAAVYGVSSLGGCCASQQEESSASLSAEAVSSHNVQIYLTFLQAASQGNVMGIRTNSDGTVQLQNLTKPGELSRSSH